VHTHNAVCNYHAALALVGLSRHRLINTRHGMGPGVYKVRQRQYYRRSLPRTAKVVTVCEKARAHFLQLRLVEARKLSVIPNGIRVGRFTPTSDSARQKLVADLGMPANTRLAGSVGRLNRIKDPATLIRAFAALQRHQSDSALLLIGKGPLQQELKALIAKEGMQHHIRLLGDRSDVPDLLSGLDMFVMASVSEGYSMALLEACAAGLPIVATAVGGNAEIVHEGINGYLVPARDPESMTAAMCKLFGNPEWARSAGQAGREWVLEHGSLQVMARRYEELYRQCL
ncbi:MAG: glycosyltransferase, partial [Salinisphaera sp.]|nr:glycosyltransferase [Salinisphaera sp.]